MSDLIFLSQAITEEIKRKIAYSSSSYLANDVYFKMVVVDLLINSFGEEKILELIKLEESKILKNIADNWYKANGFRKKFNKLLSNSSISKLSQDTLKDKDLKQKDTFEYKRLVKDMKKINCIRPEITNLYIFLINKSSIKNMSIPREYFKVLEHTTYKLIPEDKKRRVGDSIDATDKQIQ
jgi:hypothetical protein